MNFDHKQALKVVMRVAKIETLAEVIMVAFAITSLSNVHDFLASAGHNHGSAWALAIALGISLVTVSIMLCHTDFDSERTAFTWLLSAGVGLGLLSGALQYSSYSKHLHGLWPLVLGFGTPLLGEVAMAFAVNAYVKANKRARFKGIGDTLEDAVSTFLAQAVYEMDGDYIKKYLERTVNNMAKDAVDSVSNKAMKFYTQSPTRPNVGQVDTPPMSPIVPPMNGFGRPVSAISDTSRATNGHYAAPQPLQLEGQVDVTDGQMDNAANRMQQGKQEKAQARRRQLVAFILEKGAQVQIAELARLLQVKRDTIYRDLEALELAEVIRRSRDGIEVIGNL